MFDYLLRLRNSNFSSGFYVCPLVRSSFFNLFLFSTVFARLYGSNKTVFVFRKVDLLLLFLLNSLNVE